MSRGTAAALLATALAAAACGGPSADRLGIPLHKPVREQQLRALRLSSLLMPGSQLIKQVGSDEAAQRTDREPDPAFAGAIATAATTPERLLDWYAAQFANRGYRAATYYPQSGQIAGRAWTITGTREQIQVGVYRTLASVGATATAGTIAYEEVLVSYRVTGPPPG